MVPPPQIHRSSFFFKNTVFCNTLCLFAFHNFAKQFFYLTPEKYVVIFLGFLVRNEELSVFCHILGLSTEKTLFFPVKTLSHAAICSGNLLPTMLRLSKTTRDQKTKKTKAGRASFGFGWIFGFFGFALFFFWFLEQISKKHMCFFGFRGVASLKNKKNTCVFLGFLSENQTILGFWHDVGIGNEPSPEKTYVFLVFE